jgi:hypothetical protein
MAKSEQQRQKKLAKKRSKELRGRRELARRNQVMNSIAGQMQWASRFPIYKCLVSGDFENRQEAGGEGLRTVYFVRKINDGRYAFMFILLDMYCLGVKDAGCRFCTLGEWEELLERGSGVQEFAEWEPASAKKLVDQAIQYAQSLGLSPHSDYRRVSPLWGDVDASQCDRDFTFGRDGKPCYIVGPFEDNARQSFIVSKLRETVGNGNFDFTIAGTDSFSEMNDFQGFFDGAQWSDHDAVDLDADNLFADDNEDTTWDEGGTVIDGTVTGKRQYLDSGHE